MGSVFSSKEKKFAALCLAWAVFTATTGTALAAGTFTVSDGVWVDKNSKGKVVYQDEETGSEVVIDSADLDTLAVQIDATQTGKVDKGSVLKTVTECTGTADPNAVAGASAVGELQSYIPTKTSDLANDGADGSSAFATQSDLDSKADQSAVDSLSSNLTANSIPLIFDYQNGKYGYNTSSSRGADTFVPFKSGATKLGSYSGNLSIRAGILGYLYPR